MKEREMDATIGKGNSASSKLGWFLRVLDARLETLEREANEADKLNFLRISTQSI